MTEMTAIECLMTWLTQNYEGVYRTVFQNPFFYVYNAPIQWHFKD